MCVCVSVCVCVYVCVCVCVCVVTSIEVHIVKRVEKKIQKNCVPASVAHSHAKDPGQKRGLGERNGQQLTENGGEQYLQMKKKKI